MARATAVTRDAGRVRGVRGVDVVHGEARPRRNRRVVLAGGLLHARLLHLCGWILSEISYIRYHYRLVVRFRTDILGGIRSICMLGVILGSIGMRSNL